MKKALLLALPVCLLLAFRTPVQGEPPNDRDLIRCSPETLVDSDGTACQVVIVTNPSTNPPGSRIEVSATFADGSSEAVSIVPGGEVQWVCNIKKVTAHEVGESSSIVQWEVN